MRLTWEWRYRLRQEALELRRVARASLSEKRISGGAARTSSTLARRGVRKQLRRGVDQVVDQRSDHAADRLVQRAPARQARILPPAPRGDGARKIDLLQLLRS